eukprot:TRINITY_DN715_c0_g1_i1.p1 TRINITY_DN715_c0_g1~~TRINITY_DN715_c0_g1_i1.p1  ORF type:complete len:387 (-),score=76.68 TRINITY_DN715_c0_g1_i1:26-1186(-)
MNDQVVGFIAAAIAVFCLGSNLIVVKKVDTGDGMFFQFIRCTSIWVCGLIAYVVRESPTFEPLAILGGFFWAMGNVCVVPIVKCVGLSLGLLVWGSSNLVVGWASGQFGILGIQKQNDVNSPLLNYLGLGVCLVSLVMNLVVKTAVAEAPKEDGGSTKRSPKISMQISGRKESTDLDSNDTKVAVDDMGTGLLDKPATTYGAILNAERDQLESSKPSQGDSTDSFIDHLSPGKKHALGLFLALLSGVFYGVNFNPPQYLVDHGHNPNLVDYCFPHFCGIYFTSIFFFVAYCIYMRSTPTLYPEAILPAMTSGAMWSIAQIAWFIANTRLSFAVSFPIICSGPGMVGTLWGVFLFKEIRGRRNLLLVALSILISLTGIMLITLSKVL